MGGCNPDQLTPVWTLCSCLGLLLDLHISYIYTSHAWTSTTTFSYTYCFPVPISSLRPPELYTGLISVCLSCKQCNLSYQIDLHLPSLPQHPWHELRKKIVIFFSFFPPKKPMMSEKSDWPYKAHKAGNGREPYIQESYYNRSYKAENFPYRAIARLKITL